MSPGDRHGRPGRNDPCPCGSGRKYKRCCLERDAAGRYTREERGSALAKLEGFVAVELRREDDAAWLTFFERWGERLEALDAQEDEACRLSASRTATES
jgi:hypothetical protein